MELNRTGRICVTRLLVVLFTWNTSMRAEPDDVFGVFGHTRLGFICTLEWIGELASTQTHTHACGFGLGKDRRGVFVGAHGYRNSDLPARRRIGWMQGWGEQQCLVGTSGCDQKAKAGPGHRTWPPAAGSRKKKKKGRLVLEAFPKCPWLV
jgi:hypothetical protein